MKVLIIGLGSIAKKHINALRKLYSEDLEITALRRNSSPKSNLVDKEVYTLADIKPGYYDFAIISNPTSHHISTLNELTHRVNSFFIEKPLSHTIDDNITSVINQVDQRGIKTYIACNLRFLDNLKWVKKYLKEENLKINEVNVYCGSYLPTWRPDSNYKTSYSAKPELGGGVHLDLIHELDYVYDLFGSPRATQSYFSSKSSIDIQSIDFAQYLLQYEQYNINITLNYYRPFPKREMEIITAKDVLIVDLLNNTIFSQMQDRIIFSSRQRVIDTYPLQVKYFVQNVLHGKDSMNDIKEAFEVLKLTMK